VRTVTTGSPFSRHGAPAPLVTAAGLTLVEGLLTVMYGISEAVHITSDRVVMGVTTAVFFVAYGAAMMVCAWGLNRLRTWARGPVLLAQLILLGLAWNFREGETLPVAIGLAVPATIVLVGMLLPSSVDALEHGPHTED
jgi:peptidoglycan/LPS O-acetylase OafA/YrhL